MTNFFAVGCNVQYRSNEIGTIVKVSSDGLRARVQWSDDEAYWYDIKNLSSV